MKAIEKQLNDLELLRDSLLLRDNHTARKTVCEAIDTIKALSDKLEAQKLHDGWISCEERMPVAEENVLCKCQAGIYDVLRWHESNNVWVHDTDSRGSTAGYMNGFVVEWKPIKES